MDLEAIKIQEIELPAEMKRAMAKQAEAERERRAVIIASEGELSASLNLMKAADNLSRIRARCTCAPCRPSATLPPTRRKRSSCFFLPIWADGQCWSIEKK